jgi:hypothetical protein
MTPQEREPLLQFLQQLTQVRAAQKDSEADALIREACAQQPDAAYLLVQRAMQLEHVLKAKQAECMQLQSELDKARSATQTSFLGDINAWGRQPGAQTPSPSPVAAAAPARAAAPSPAPAPSSWGAGILGNVATTAAGVVAGSFLFQGIENLMGHHGQGGASNLVDAHAPVPAGDTIINNYYEGAPPDDTVDLSDAGGDFGGDDVV